MKKKETLPVPVVDKVSKPVVPMTREAIKKIIFDMSTLEGELDRSYDQLSKIIPDFIASKGKQTAAILEKVNTESTDLLLAYETETHIGLMSSFDRAYRGMAKEMCKQLIKEYSCNTHAEKMLVEIVVNDFIRVLEISRRLNNCMNAGEYISPNRTQYLAMLSKQIDRSHRQYLTSLMTLKQLKAPAIEMNIRANTAFVSQNQQINAPTHETNDAK